MTGTSGGTPDRSPELDVHGEAARTNLFTPVKVQMDWAEALRENWSRRTVAAAGQDWRTHLVKFDGTVLPRRRDGGGTPQRSPELDVQP